MLITSRENILCLCKIHFQVEKYAFEGIFVTAVFSVVVNLEF